MRLEPYWTVGFMEGEEWIGVLSFDTRKEARKFVREMNFSNCSTPWTIRKNQGSLMGEVCGGLIWGAVADGLETAMNDEKDE